MSAHLSPKKSFTLLQSLRVLSRSKLNYKLVSYGAPNLVRQLNTLTSVFPASQSSSSSIMSEDQQVRNGGTSSSSQEQADDVLFETVQGKGIITLNRPRALHALNLSMVRKIRPVLQEWESTQRFVIIKATGGKAFCAGGDVRAVTESAAIGGSLYKDFFREEYELNGLIGTLHIPYIALIDGITMGGGVGLSVHGRYRVATERTLFAMPETRIGLFPDVGTSHFLPRLGGKLGLYLALTGERLKGGDVFKAGIATHVCDSSKMAALEQDLISLDSKSVEPKDIEKVLRKYHDQCALARAPFSLQSRLPKIDTLFGGQTIEEILERLEKEAESGSDAKWAKDLLGVLSQMSPTSMKVTLRLLEMGAGLDLQEALQIEYRLSQRCCENHDFIEGVRALLIDKDNSPVWKPKGLAEVSPEVVESYFAPLDEAAELRL